MYLNNTKISHSKLVQMFSDVFDGKVLGVVSELVISPDVYNGKCKLFSQNELFMRNNNITPSSPHFLHPYWLQ